jgi:hypothetical protein
MNYGFKSFLEVYAVKVNAHEYSSCRFHYCKVKCLCNLKPEYFLKTLLVNQVGLRDEVGGRATASE